MRTLRIIHFPVVTVLMLCILSASCTSSKHTALSCPEIPGYRGSKATSGHSFSKYKLASARKEAHVKHTGRHIVKMSGKGYTAEIKSGDTRTLLARETVNPGRAVMTGYPAVQATKYGDGLVSPVFLSYSPGTAPVHGAGTDPVFDPSRQEQACDTIYLRSGSKIKGKVEEIGQFEIKYRRCENLTGPMITISKNEVASITYNNGYHDYFVADSPVANNAMNVYPAANPAPPKVEGLGLAGFIASLTGLFIAGIPLGTLAVVFGAISLSTIKKYPQKYRGKGLAVWAVVLGLADVILTAIALATL